VSRDAPEDPLQGAVPAPETLASLGIEPGLLGIVSLPAAQLRRSPAFHFTIPSGSIRSTLSSFAAALIAEVNPDLLNNA